MNKILNIEEVNNYNENYEGYQVTTENFVAYILIDNRQQCCEKYGYLSSDDDIESFIGKDLVNISVVNDALEKTNLKLEKEQFGVMGDCMFVNLEFSDGSELQLTAYNFHYGYYGHDVLFMIDDKIIEKEYI